MASVIEKDFLAFIKPFDSSLSLDDPRNFYMEREWRKYGNLGFTPQQIQKVIVAAGYKKRLLEKFPEYDEKIFEI